MQRWTNFGEENFQKVKAQMMGDQQDVCCYDHCKAKTPQGWDAHVFSNNIAEPVGDPSNEEHGCKREDFWRSKSGTMLALLENERGVQASKDNGLLDCVYYHPVE